MDKEYEMRTKLKKAIQLITVIFIGILMVATVVAFARRTSNRVYAAGPIPPPVGYPKLTLSTKVVSPTVASPDDATLVYSLKILNTGAYSASDVTLVDTIPPSTTYNEDLASDPPLPTLVFTDGMILWEHGEVGFDTSVVITFSVKVTPGFEGTIENTAVISDPMIAQPITVTAATNVTDHPIFEISKAASPALPGKNKPLTYELTVTNVGQDAVNTPITITDIVPTDLTFIGAGQGGTYTEGVVTWFDSVDLGFDETSMYTFSVQLGDVPSGTVINNDTYLVVSQDDIRAGDPYSTTVVDPIFILSKSVFPDPPGANREMTYTLTLLNLGSKATDVVITDTVPISVEYRRGGEYLDGVVTWKIPSLDTRESAQVTYTVLISDVADVIVTNDDYEVCSAEDVCAPGIPTPSYIVGPTFGVTATVDPIAHKPGGGSDPKEKVTPILTIHNLGPGNAIDANVLLTFGNISVSNADVITVKPPGNGAVIKEPSCNLWANCYSYFWTGNIDVGEVITITTIDPQSTIGGEEWTPYTATVVVTDVLGAYVTKPITATAVGHVTHMSNLIPIKTAPSQIGSGQTMTYTIQVVNSGLSNEAPPVLTETVPASVTLDMHSIKDGGTVDTSGDRTVIMWPLPDMGPGDSVYRSFTVVANPNLVSGTLIVNDEYQTSVYESYIKGIKTIIGEPVTTTVHEVGLIDSYKTVSPTWALPGTGTVLTYTVHVVNSGPYDLSDVKVSDIFPWEHTTFQRDAVASEGSLSSDIVSLEWMGDVASNSEQLITFTVLVDDFFEGVVTNTATISHESLLQDKVITAVGYITDKPVLRISKTATPDPVMAGNPLLYQIEVTNLGQQATLLVITDTIPADTTYVFSSASSGGMLVGNQVQWHLPVLNPGESVTLTFLARVLGGNEVTNSRYRVSCDEGVSAVGEPVTTRVISPIKRVMLPITFK
jgi:uncharacterized repeat protein (TIGR01451 family)